MVQHVCVHPSTKILLGMVHWRADFIFVKLIKSKFNCRVYCHSYNFSFLKNVSHSQGKYVMDIDQTRTMFKSPLAYNQENNNTNIIRNNLKKIIKLLLHFQLKTLRFQRSLFRTVSSRKGWFPSTGWPFAPPFLLDPVPNGTSRVL